MSSLLWPCLACSSFLMSCSARNNRKTLVVYSTIQVTGILLVLPSFPRAELSGFTLSCISWLLFQPLRFLRGGRTETVAGHQGIENIGVHYSEQSKSQSPSIRFPSDEVSSSGDEFTTKVRKPYTITKQRERWTEEEHHKFLEALKMHGRAWRRIEEPIGTKTAVQIRSHAQKFFSKLEREASAGGVPMGKAQDISIPPHRPKRKPSHPYPRKAGPASQIGPSTNEEENRSPSAVSSTPDRLCADSNLGGETRKNTAFAPYNARLGLLQTHDQQSLLDGFDYGRSGPNFKMVSGMPSFKTDVFSLERS